MPYKIQLYVAGDELSKRMLKAIDKMIKLLSERFGPGIELSTRDFIAYVLTTSAVPLNTRLGAPDAIHLSIYSALEAYREELRAKFEIIDFPAIKLDDVVYVGEEALEVVSKLHELLKRFHSMRDDELMLEIRNLASRKSAAESELSIWNRGADLSTIKVARPADPLVAEEASSRIAIKASADARSSAAESAGGVTSMGNVIMAGLLECLARLERLREEGKIDENTYRKMKEVYDSLLR